MDNIFRYKLNETVAANGLNAGVLNINFKCGEHFDIKIVGSKFCKPVLALVYC